MKPARTNEARHQRAAARVPRDGLITAAFVALLVAIGAFAVHQSFELRRALADNDAIRALALGQSVPLRDGAPGPLLLAAAAQVLSRDDLTAAEALAPRIQTAGDAKVQAAFLYALANARMRAGFELIEANDIDEATVTIRLAQEDYRRAMRLDPEDFDVKVNFDLASRLVRVFPRPAIEREEEGKRPRDVWTDLPGVPRGLP
ncbi:hypothetical protein [Jiella pacifica]|uniref:MxaK protein n=1 Tax=Jiella pacifica TaxID=2696469 RepID=A0A6N9T8E0_9HYPH|nr:hypothetical protein [Jiella pacifica]NDW05979.1 hypothetical protein [Jiella pacifica]